VGYAVDGHDPAVCDRCGRLYALEPRLIFS
jgi:hypothetical protein